MTGCDPGEDIVERERAVKTNQEVDKRGEGEGGEAGMEKGWVFFWALLLL